MELRDELAQRSEIRRQMARTELFRGERAMPMASSGLLTPATAGFQAAWLPDPAEHLTAHLVRWIGAAVVGAVGAGAELAPRSRQIAWLAVEQFSPRLIAGALLSVITARSATEGVWRRPGLWQVLSSPGIFASCRPLPRATTFGVAVSYLASGLASLILARGKATPSPWATGLPLGVGQLLAATVLDRRSEHSDVSA
ncbi:MAG TPA: hypothetical protein VKP69_10320 [Isosphaeraceae bacterium]|nr:hypothetical protein [Isosphaeraceae bacterium]